MKSAAYSASKAELTMTSMIWHRTSSGVSVTATEVVCIGLDVEDHITGSEYQVIVRVQSAVVYESLYCNVSSFSRCRYLLR